MSITLEAMQEDSMRKEASQQTVVAIVAVTTIAQMALRYGRRDFPGAALELIFLCAARRAPARRSVNSTGP